MPFDSNLDGMRQRLENLEKGASKAIEWTLDSTSFKILKEIRRPEAVGGWPIDTKTSWKKWGFERAKITGDKVIYEIFNDAKVSQQRRARGARPLRRGGGESYAKWVYAKGDGLLRRPIAPNIVKRAIISATPTIEENFYRILDKYLAKRGNSR